MRTQCPKAIDQLAHEGIHWNQAFGLELSERHENGPLVRPQRAHAIQRQVGAFPDTHAGVALQQQDVAGQIVAAQEFLLNELVLFRGQSTRQSAILARDIVAGEQMIQGWQLAVPGEVLQEAAQSDDDNGESVLKQRRGARLQMSQPAEDMRIALQLFQPGNLGVMGFQVVQKAPKRGMIASPGRIAEGNGSRIPRSARRAGPRDDGEGVFVSEGV